ncbi:MAG: Holliday junction branch migration protein RuvA [bacterium]|nr:Holliday junction branch migration protein RuvA [bacterium]
MISFLQGILFEKSKNNITVLVGGVGYKVFTTSKVLELENNSSLNLYCYSHIREDQFTIFGFLEKKEMGLFENLISVSGVGPKTALAVIDTLGHDKTINSIQTADVGSLQSVSGLGKKSAQKIVVDLQNKIGKVDELDLSDSVQTEEVTLALISLGFSQADLNPILKDIDKSLSVENQIKFALKMLKKK